MTRGQDTAAICKLPSLLLQWGDSLKELQKKKGSKLEIKITNTSRYNVNNFEIDTMYDQQTSKCQVKLGNFDKKILSLQAEM